LLSKLELNDGKVEVARRGNEHVTAQIRSNFKTNMAHPHYQMLRRGAEGSGTVVSTVFSSRKADPCCRYDTSHCASHSRTALCLQTHYLAQPRSYSVLRLEFKMAVQFFHSKKLIYQIWVLRCCTRKSLKNIAIFYWQCRSKFYVL